MTTHQMHDAARPDDTIADDRTDTEDMPAAPENAQDERPDGRPGVQYEHGEQVERPATDDTSEQAQRPATDDTSTALFEADERQSMTSRWHEIQAEFVDEPKRAVHAADALVTELMARLTRRLAEEHESLEACWSGQETISTEDLRQGLQRYRSFFERLLAA